MSARGGTLMMGSDPSGDPDVNIFHDLSKG